MEQVYYESLIGENAMPGLPVVYHPVHKTPPGVFAAAHWQDTAELIYVKRGAYRVIAGGVLRDISAGEGVLIRPRQIHTTICPDMDDIELAVLKFAPGPFLPEEEAMRPVLQEGPAIWLPCGLSESNEIGKLLEKIEAEWKAGRPGWRTAVKSSISLILVCFYRLRVQTDRSPAAVDPGWNKQFYPVFRYLEEHFTEPVRTEKLLDLCHLSYSRFSVRFRLLTGFCLTEYVSRARIQLARKLLAESDMPVTEVAEKCGYLDICYFERLFRRYVGCSPSQFRRTHVPCRKP